MLYHEYLNDDRGGKPPTQHTKYVYFVCAVCAVVAQACDSSIAAGPYANPAATAGNRPRRWLHCFEVNWLISLARLRATMQLANA